jgi:hypothetical protein
MSQDHMCYNMSVVSVEVRGIMDLDATAEVLCPESGNPQPPLLARNTDEISKNAQR